MPHDQPNIAETIRASGRRLTVQRAKILDALHRLPGHSTAEQIHALVCQDEQHVEMALSTVYRNLDALTEMGLITAFADAGGVMTHEWSASEAPHHHLLCEGCGHTQEVELKSISTLSDEVQQEHGFAIDLRHMAIRGQCADCQRSASNDEATR
ncbi:MAG: Fur family transcriptional regulator [Chloroflexi bacterium]|nr:Fur family transcriptional regulator [Chloroflexota bacterium]